MGTGTDQEISTKVSQSTYPKNDIVSASTWFAEHVTLFGRPYTLDDDQVRAAIDVHKNTLVTARAGSGKTRVIVAKVAYLIAHGLATFDEIAIFMFNRAAAAEVNERLAAVQVDGKNLTSFSSVDPENHLGHPQITVASTFHKYALDLVKLSGQRPIIIPEPKQTELIQHCLAEALTELDQKLSPTLYREFLSLTANFITRAGQKFPGRQNLPRLQGIVNNYCSCHQNLPNYAKHIRIHRIAMRAYEKYLSALKTPHIDFNLLLSTATNLLNANFCPAQLRAKITPLKYILIDEYQDFSYLFFALIKAMRKLAPASHLFAVGDDWQAINRFAGSDVDYFLNFAKFFPEDSINIPLATNYRSHRRIVDQANSYMLTNYNPTAIPAIPYNKQKGKIISINPQRIRFDATDVYEDGYGDGRYVSALRAISTAKNQKVPPDAVKLLKATVKIITHHPHDDFMLLHRHNFMSFEGISLAGFTSALRQYLIEQGIMSADNSEQRIRSMTMHKSKGLESENVILLELDRDIVQSEHPHATIFELFGDTRDAEIADQERLIYVAMTRAKKRLYLLSSDEEPIIGP